jgi:hypothetical protein
MVLRKSYDRLTKSRNRAPAETRPELRPAVREIGPYQQMTAGFSDALAETERLGREPRSRGRH